LVVLEFHNRSCQTCCILCSIDKAIFAVRDEFVAAPLIRNNHRNSEGLSLEYRSPERLIMTADDYRTKAVQSKLLIYRRLERNTIA
jgi:hypothetical protein